MFGTMESENLAETEFSVETGRRDSQPVVLYDRSLSKDEDKMRVLGLCYTYNLQNTKNRGSFFEFTENLQVFPIYRSIV